jgi:hypothetical protein
VNFGAQQMHGKVNLTDAVKRILMNQRLVMLDTRLEQCSNVSTLVLGKAVGNTTTDRNTFDSDNMAYFALHILFPGRLHGALNMKDME